METARRSLGFLTKLLAGVVVLYALGFLVFAGSLPHRPEKVAHADGIVALTGGDARLDTAVSLLEHGAGKRLLITGVHPAITKPEIKQLAHGGRKFDCCADLDFAAEDTRGNAAEAAGWVKAHRYKSLILVTANYHMPRSLAEFSADMPGVRLEPYPVEPEGVDFAAWWRNAHTMRLLQAEYVKYLASFVLNRFISQDVPATDTHRRG
jgi:uncharacterized SAM-binding protein YcdF (DUF218 family)